MFRVALISMLPGLMYGLLEVATYIDRLRVYEQRQLQSAAWRAAASLDREIAGLAGLLANVATELESEPSGTHLHGPVAAIAGRLGLRITIEPTGRQPPAPDQAPDAAPDPAIAAALRVAPFGGVTDVVARPNLGTDAVFVFQPVTRAGSSVGVIDAPFDEDRIRGTLHDVYAHKQIAMDVLDSHGVLVARLAPPGSAGLRSGASIQLEASDRSDGTLRAEAADGTEIFAAFARPARSPGWLVVASVPQQEYNAAWAAPLAKQLATFLFMMLFAVTCAYWLGDRLARPLALLGRRAEAAAAGAPCAAEVPPSPVREFEALRESQLRAEAMLQSRVAAERAALEEARTSSELLASVMDATADLISVIGLDGRYVLANRAALAAFAGDDESRMLGRRPTEMLGLELGCWLEAADREVLRTGGPVWREGRWTLPGGEMRFYSVSKSPWRDATGHITGIVAVTRDITDQRAAESRLRLVQAELLRASRLSAMGAMASGLAHELNQPLSAAANFLSAAERLTSEGGPPPVATEALHEASAQVRRAGEIVRRLRNFVGRGEAELEEVDLGDLLAETEELTHAGNILGGVDLAVSPPAQPILVLADRVQVQQVLLNLIRNAAEAIVAAGRPGRVGVTAQRHRSGGAEISVTDNGPGLPPEILARLFSPFVSTKCDGMGIGLAICQTIAEGHGGQLTVDTGPQGTIFRVILPPVPRLEHHDEHDVC